MLRRDTYMKFPGQYVKLLLSLIFIESTCVSVIKITGKICHTFWYFECNSYLLKKIKHILGDSASG